MSLALTLTSVLEKLVLVSLLILSVWSIAIMIEAQRKLKAFKDWSSVKSEEVQNLIRARNWPALKQWSSSSATLLTAGAMKRAMDDTNMTPPLVDRSVKSYLNSEKLKLEKGLAVLATLGANAPFIGLFGTVLGIIRSFAALADNEGAATSVMSGISQALFATAAGLFVAIPAVVAYNTFSSRIRNQIASSELLKDLYLAYRESK